MHVAKRLTRSAAARVCPGSIPGVHLMAEPIYDSRIEDVRMSVADRVRRAFSDRRLVVKSFARENYYFLGLGTPSSASDYVSTVRSGRRHGFSQKGSRGFPFTRTELARLSKLFVLLDILPEDEVTVKIKGVAPDFKYPQNVRT